MRHVIKFCFSGCEAWCNASRHLSNGPLAGISPTGHANAGTQRMDVDRSGRVDEPRRLAKGDARMMNRRDERRHHRSLAPTMFERLLALGSLLLLASVAVALVRGHSEWSRVPVLVWLHLATISLCLALTPMLLLGRRGARRHRQLGYAWVAAMTVTALITFGIRDIGHGGLSAIHILSAIVLIQAPRLAVACPATSGRRAPRLGPVARHRLSSHGRDLHAPVRPHARAMAVRLIGTDPMRPGTGSRSSGNSVSVKVRNAAVIASCRNATNAGDVAIDDPGRRTSPP